MCIESKLMEHIIVSNMMDYFDTHNILCPQQHGFRSKHICATQRIGFTQEITDSVDQGQQTDVIVMDFSKAFDKVDHHKLVHKLKHMGVNPYITTWIKDFLHNRSQQVLVENKVSHSLPVLSGVPQGYQESCASVCRRHDNLLHNKITRICTKSSGRLTQSRTLGKRMVNEI